MMGSYGRYGFGGRISETPLTPAQKADQIARQVSLPAVAQSAAIAAEVEQQKARRRVLGGLAVLGALGVGSVALFGYGLYKGW